MRVARKAANLFSLFFFLEISSFLLEVLLHFLIRIFLSFFWNEKCIFWNTFDYTGWWVIKNFHLTDFRKQGYFFGLSYINIISWFGRDCSSFCSIARSRLFRSSVLFDTIIKIIIFLFFFFARNFLAMTMSFLYLQLLFRKCVTLVACSLIKSLLAACSSDEIEPNSTFDKLTLIRLGFFWE